MTLTNNRRFNIDLLSDILSVLKLSGTLYFRTEFSGEWGVRVPSYENVARFHIVHRGRCWVQVEGLTEPILVEQGDLIIIPRGAMHVLANGPDCEVTELDKVVADSGFNGTGALVWGNASGRHATELICGHFAFATGATHPLIEALPPCLHLKRYDENVQIWLKQTMDIIGSEVNKGALGADLIALKLSETICAQAIRSYLVAEGSEHLVLAGFADKRINAALSAMHQHPAKRWTIADLAREATLSRTGFAQLFKSVMGQSPLEYLTRWRMQLARQKLASDSQSIIQIAEQVGYASESAFSRVFKRCTGLSPSAVRKIEKTQGTHC